MTLDNRAATEEDIRALVRRFYALSLDDDLLGPMFRETIPDLEAHYPVVEDFWSTALLGTARYPGSAFTKHVHLTIEPAHFDRWLAAFTQAVDETLPAAAADSAMKRARQMTQSFKVGLLPLPTPKRPVRPAESNA